MQQNMFPALAPNISIKTPCETLPPVPSQRLITAAVDGISKGMSYN